MKYSGCCPKCNSREVYYDIDKKLNYERGNLIIGHNKFIGSVNAQLETYICLSCGYVEEYLRQKDLESEKVRQKVKEKWKKVGS